MFGTALVVIVGVAGLALLALRWRGERRNKLRQFAILWLGIGWLAGLIELLAVASGLDLWSAAVLPMVVIVLPMLLLMGLILGVYYFIRARDVDLMISGVGLLAHWTYNRDEWRRYAEGEQRTRLKELKLALGLAAVVMLLFVAASPFLGIGMEGLSSTAVALIVCAMTALAMVGFGLPALVLTDPRRRTSGEAYIARNGVLLNGSPVFWSLGIRLDGVRLTDGEPALLQFDYSAQTRYGAVAHTLRVPIPNDKAAEAQSVLDAFKPREVKAHECAHPTLLPRWDSAADMGHEERATSFVCEACNRKFNPVQAARIREGLPENEPPSAAEVAAQAARDAAFGAALARGCPHTTLLPRWDSAADMGHADRASQFVCEACHETFTPAEVATMRQASAAAAAR